MTAALEAELAELLKRASPRPWSLEYGYGVNGPDGERAWCFDVNDGPTPSDQDKALVIAAVNALPALLAELAASKAREEKLRAALEDAYEVHRHAVCPSPMNGWDGCTCKVLDSMRAALEAK